MKTKYKILIFSYFFFIDFMLYAQPTDEDNGGDLEGNDPPATPINNSVFLLAVFAVMYAFCKLKKGKVLSNCQKNL